MWNQLAWRRAPLLHLYWYKNPIKKFLDQVYLVLSHAFFNAGNIFWCSMLCLINSSYFYFTKIISFSNPSSQLTLGVTNESRQIRVSSTGPLSSVANIRFMFQIYYSRFRLLWSVPLIEVAMGKVYKVRLSAIHMCVPLLFELKHTHWSDLALFDAKYGQF